MHVHDWNLENQHIKKKKKYLLKIFASVCLKV